MYTSFSEVTAALSKKLHDLKYSDGTIQKYEREWTRFENYLSKNNIEQYDMETVKDYFFSKYNVLFDATAKEHSRSMRQTMRALRTLIDFKNHGVIYRRVSGKDHSIPSGFQEPVHDFLSKAEETLASSSCRQYRTHVECFVSFLHEQGICNFSELTPEIIKSFWKTRESLSKQTKEYDAYVLRKLLDFLYESKTCAVDLSVFVPKVKGNHKGSIPSFYTVEELTKLLSMVDRFNPTGKRDYAILAVYLVEQGLNLRRVKTREPQVEAAVLDVLQQIRQEVIVPRAGDLVEGDVQRLLAGLVDVHHSAGHFGVAKAHGHGQTLVTADDGHVCVDHQGVGKPKLLNGVLDLLVLFIPRLQFLSGVVLCRFKYRYRQHLQFRSFLHSLPPP